VSDQPCSTDEMLEALEDVLNQACRLPDGLVDSGALRSYADGLRLLAKHGRFKIEIEVGRRVIGRWIDEVPGNAPSKG